MGGFCSCVPGKSNSQEDKLQQILSGRKIYNTNKKGFDTIERQLDVYHEEHLAMTTDETGSNFTHDSEVIGIVNRINGSYDQRNFVLPSGTWQQKLNKINEEITKFNINEDTRCVFIASNDDIRLVKKFNEIINLEDVTQFEQVLSKIPAGIDIKIYQADEYESMHGWTSLQNLFAENNDGYLGPPVHRNDTEIIIPFGDIMRGVIQQGSKMNYYVSSLIKYDVIKDECIKLIKFEQKLDCSPYCVAIDKENDKIYMPGRSGIYKIDLTTHKVDIINIENTKEYSWDEGDLKSIIIDNALHIFYYNDTTRSVHAIYDLSNGKIQYDVPKVGWDSEQSNELADHPQIIYIKSQSKLLFISGCFAKYAMFFDLKYRSWKMKTRFKLKASTTSGRAGAIITKDEKYVIALQNLIFDERNPKKSDPKINIFDLENESSEAKFMKLPCKGDSGQYVSAFVANDYQRAEIVIKGYLRDMLERKESVLEVCDMIMDYYNKEECVHLFEPGSGNHWKIPVDDILRSEKFTMY
eukprot:216706_1